MASNLIWSNTLIDMRFLVRHKLVIASPRTMTNKNPKKILKLIPHGYILDH